MTFKNEVEEVCGHRPKSWTWHSWDADNDDARAYLWYDHYTNEDSGDPQPLPFEALEALDERWGVVEVESHSDGETGSKLSVLLRDVLA